jgi:transcriptional/translational regulatory protein YebC/TACO1
MVYIQGAKRKGMSRDDIIKNLKKAGWTKEQVNYALQKYEGKKIAGLIHPPLNIGSQEQEKKPKKK